MKLLPLVLLFLATPAYAASDPCATPPPPQFQRPVTVPTYVQILPQAEMYAWCHKDPAMQATVTLDGCTYLPSPGRPFGQIALSAALTPAGRRCVLIYELSHLPPNNWIDPVMEAQAPDDPKYFTLTPMNFGIPEVFK